MFTGIENLVYLYQSNGHPRSIQELLGGNLIDTVYVTCRKIIECYCLMEDGADASENTTMFASIVLEIYTSHLFKLCDELFKENKANDQQRYQPLVKISGHSQCVLLLTCISYAYKFLYGEDACIRQLDDVHQLIWQLLSRKLQLYIDCVWKEALTRCVATLEIELCYFHDWRLAQPMLLIFGFYSSCGSKRPHFQAQLRLHATRTELLRLWMTWTAFSTYKERRLTRPVFSYFQPTRHAKCVCKNVENISSSEDKWFDPAAYFV